MSDMPKMPKPTSASKSGSRSHRGRRGGPKLSEGARLHASGPVAGEVVAEMYRYAGTLDTADDAALELQRDLGGIVTEYLHGKQDTKLPKKRVEARAETQQEQLFLLEPEEPDWKLSEETKAIGRRGVAEARAALAAVRDQATDAEVAVFVPTPQQKRVADAAAMVAAREMYAQAVQDGHITQIPEQFR